jgi:tetratricopeptide (TPR) repeat protein
MRMSGLVAALSVLASPASAQQSIGAKPQFLAAYNLGVEAENKGLHDRAIGALTRAISLKPDFAAAYESRGVAYDQKGLYDQAIADYTQAIAMGAASAETYFNRGAAYEHRRTYSKALADYRTALALDAGLQAAKDGAVRLASQTDRRP